LSAYVSNPGVSLLPAERKISADARLLAADRREARAIDSVSASYHISAMIDWTNCPDVESVSGKCSGAWVVRGTRVIVESCILGNAADCTPEEVADMFGLPVEVVRRILRFAAVA
jgi:uncharacterized protein (DUF433 family)